MMNDMILGFGFIALFIMGFIVLMAVAALAFMIWAIVDCLNSGRQPAEKVLWILLILTFNILGSLLYLLLRKGEGDKGDIMVGKSKNTKGEKDAKGQPDIKKLTRSKTDRKIAGICGGLADYLGIDSTVIRLLWVLFTLAGGAGLLAYIIAWIIIPEEE